VICGLGFARDLQFAIENTQFAGVAIVQPPRAHGADHRANRRDRKSKITHDEVSG
jgi:hypothetical protein